ncbi:MAG: transporter substrate-binding domain-containing protein [Alphaproteobacteria bacterium]|nr:transporter substrate-binding domain-containing protein [Alphaproteobacteria bacterium]
MKNALSTLVLAALVALAVSVFMSRTSPLSTPDRPAETVYDRVTRTGVIRCGYTPYSVGLMKDPNTGKLGGIYYDIVQELAKNLSLKAEYVEEVGWGQQIEGLNNDRFDLICSPTSLNSGRARAADFTIPLYYSPVTIWARANDARFDGNMAAINDPSVKISTLDGEQTAVFARNFFPKAQQVALPQMSPFSDLMMQVTANKADVTFAEPFAVHEFMETNPNSLRQVKTAKPLVIVPNVMPVKRDQFAFKEMIDNGLRELFNTGFIDRAIDKYEKYPNSYVRETAMR